MTSVNLKMPKLGSVQNLNNVHCIAKALDVPGSHRSTRADRSQPHLLGGGSANWLLDVQCGDIQRFDTVHMHQQPPAENELWSRGISLLHSAVEAERH